MDREQEFRQRYRRIPRVKRTVPRAVLVTDEDGKTTRNPDGSLAVDYEEQSVAEFRADQIRRMGKHAGTIAANEEIALYGRRRGKLGRPQQLIVRDAADMFIKSKTLTPDSVRTYRQYLQRTPIADLDVADVTRELIQDIVDEYVDDGHDWSAHHFAMYARAFFDWALDEEWVREVPKIKVPKHPKSQRKPLADWEVDGLAKAAKGREWWKVRANALLYTLLSTGCRRKDIIQLEYLTWDRDDRIWVARSKGDKSRYVIVESAARSAIVRYAQAPDTVVDDHGDMRKMQRGDQIFRADDGKATTVHGVRDILDDLAAEAGLKGITPHRLRHTFATAHAVVYGNLQTLAYLLGHEDIQMSHHYSKLAASITKRGNTVLEQLGLA
jgi:site-specific recombinase XerD